MMLESYLNLRLKYISNDDLVFDFPKHIKKIKQVLLILPPEIRDPSQHQKFVSGLADIFKNVKVNTFQRVKLKDYNQNWLGVPKTKYINQLKDREFDLIIDLNEYQDKICTYLCALSGAPVRLNLASGKYDHIYNLHFRCDQTKTIQEKYSNILNYLNSLRVTAKSV